MLSVIANMPNNEVQIFHCNYKLLAQRDILEHILISKKYLSEHLYHCVYYCEHQSAVSNNIFEFVTMKRDLFDTFSQHEGRTQWCSAG